MAVSFKVIRFQKTSTTTDGTTQDIDATFVPKGCIVISTGTLTADAAQAHFQFSYGFSDGTNNKCTTVISRDAQTTENNAKISHSTACVLRLSDAAATTVLDRARISFPAGGTFGANTIRFTWDICDTGAMYVTVIVFGGTDITNVKVGTHTVVRTTAGTEDVTGLGFNPEDGKAVLFATTHGSPTLDSASTGAIQGFGVATSSTKRHSHAIAITNASDPSTTWAYHRNASFVSFLTSAGAVNAEMDFTSWITDGFRFNAINPPSASDLHFHYMVINGGTWDCGTDTIQTSNTTKNHAVSVSSSTLRGLMTMMPNPTLGWQSADVIGNDHAIQNYGASDGTTESYNVTLDEDNQATTDSYRLVGGIASNTNRCLAMMTLNGAVQIAADFSSFGTNQYTLSYTTTTGTASPFGWVVVADSAVQNLSRPISESYNVTESLTRSQTLTRPIGESYNVTESVGAVVSRTRNISESYNVAEVLTRAQTLARQIAESYNVTDAVTRAQTLTRLINENYNVTEAVTALVSKLRAISESYNVTEAITRLVAFQRAISETYNVAESITRSQQLTRQISESYNVSEVITMLKSLIRNIAETYNVSEVVTRSQTLTRQIAETYNVIDAVTRLVARTRAINESFNVAEVITRFQQLARQLTETYNVTDTVARTVAFTRIIAETYNVAESVIRSQILSRNIPESYNVDEAVTRIINFTRNIAENYDVNESLDRIVSLFRELQESYNVSEDVAYEKETPASGVFTRNISESYSVSDTVTREQTLQRIISELYDVTDTVTRQLAATRNIDESYNIEEDLTYQITTSIVREITESYNISEAITTESILQRIIQESYDVTDTVTKEGGEEPIVIDEHFNVSGGTGGFGRMDFSRLKRRIVKKVIKDLIPEDDDLLKNIPDKIYINNQKAFLIDPDNNPQNIIVAPVRTLAKLYKFKNIVTSEVVNRKQYRVKQQLNEIYRQLENNKISKQEYIDKIPQKILVRNCINGKILNKEFSNKVESSIRIKPQHNNQVTARITVIATIPNTIKANIQTNNIHKNVSVSSLKVLNESIPHKITTPIKVRNTTYEKATSKVIITKDKVKKDIKSLLLDKGKAAYDKLIANIVHNTKDSDDKEHLYYYIQTYQQRFNIEQTNTNKKLGSIEKEYKKEILSLFKEVTNTYANDLPRFIREAKAVYGDRVKAQLRKIAQEGYNLSIDYISNATNRSDIYITDTDLANVKEGTEKSYNHFFESAEKYIKAKQNEEMIANIPNIGTIENNNPPFPLDDTSLLLINGLSTAMLALATISKLEQLQQAFESQNVRIRFVFITENDVRVCKYCLPYDYRLSGKEFTLEEKNLIPKIPLHLNCRCRVLLKIGSQIIVK